MAKAVKAALVAETVQLWRRWLQQGRAGDALSDAVPGGGKTGGGGGAAVGV